MYLNVMVSLARPDAGEIEAADFEFADKDYRLINRLVLVLLLKRRVMRQDVLEYLFPDRMTFPDM